MSDSIQHKYLVCIHCMTYNHKQYILDALNGFVMQETKFPFVALVMDDASTDGAPEVIRQYIVEQCDSSTLTHKDDELYELIEINAKKNSNCHFAFYFLKENLYGTDKKYPMITEWNEKAKYIAACEGDDFWTESHKLQKQVDVLETHQDCVIAFNKVRVIDNHSETNWTIPKNNQLRSGVFTFPDYINEEFLGKGYCFHYSSYLRRSSLCHEFHLASLKEPFNLFTGDFALKVFYLMHGNGYYCEDEMGCYRFMTEGSHNYRKLLYPEKAIQQKSNEIKGYDILDKMTGEQFHEAFASGIQYGLHYIYRHAVRLPYKQCRDAFMTFFSERVDKDCIQKNHMLLRYKYLPFPVFYFLERIRQKMNRSSIETL